MNVNIVSNDPRYEILNQIFNENGYNSKIVKTNEVDTPDILVLPIKSSFSNEEYKAICTGINDDTIVFSGEAEKISSMLGTMVVDYSKSESFLLENAYITAESALAILLNRLQKVLSQSKILVIGYGRIGKYLSKMLLALNASVYIFARREESIKDAALMGAEGASLECLDYDAVINTAPNKIVPKSITDNYKSTLYIDLASNPGGFEDENVAEKALKLPGKMKKESAAYAIYSFINNYLSSSLKKGG